MRRNPLSCLELLEQLENKKLPEERFQREIKEYFNYIKAEAHVRDLDDKPMAPIYHPKS